MSKTLLSEKDITELMSILKHNFDYITDLKKKEILAKHIQYPRIPSLLTESLMVYFIRNGKIDLGIKFEDVKLGKNSDIEALKNGKKHKIEVKATGDKAFQYFGEKDINADYLIWIHFGSFFFNRQKEVKVFVLENPASFFKKTLKITLKKFINVSSNNLKTFEINLDS